LLRLCEPALKQGKARTVFPSALLRFFLRQFWGHILEIPRHFDANPHPHVSVVLYQPRLR
jgi:hypothetical protein